MTAHVHQRSAAGSFPVVEPVAVRARVLLALTHEIDRSDGALAHQVTDPLVLRREAQLFGVHQLPVLRLARRDHLVGLLEREAQRLFDDDVPADLRRGDCDTRVQVVRQADVHDLAVRARDRLVDVREPLRDAVLQRERARPLVGPRIDANHFGVRDETVVGLGMDVRDESGTKQQDSGSAHVVQVVMASVVRCAAARRNS